jgi:hypothetical protein
MTSMFEELTTAIETLDIPPSCAAVTEVAGLHAALGSRLTMALAEVDASDEWALDGSASMAVWMRNHLGVTHTAAAKVLKTGRRLRSLRGTAAAWLAGRLTDGQIDVIVANVTERRAGLWASHETALVPGLADLDLEGTKVAMQTWAARADAVLDEDEPPAPPVAEATLAQTLDGQGYLKASFDAEGHQVVTTALRLAETDDPELTAAQRRGQAMLDVFRHYLDTQRTKLGKRHRPHVNIVIHDDDLRAGRPGRTLHGTPLPGLVVRKLTCDANIHRVITDGASSILDYGRSTRSIPPAVYTSLVLRDLGCRFPGCDRPAEWCEGHHIRHWEDGGTTDLSNLVLLCSKHHHVIHTKAWHIKLRPDGALEVTHPDGTVRTSSPPLLC